MIFACWSKVVPGFGGQGEVIEQEGSSRRNIFAGVWESLAQCADVQVYRPKRRSVSRSMRVVLVTAHG